MNDTAVAACPVVRHFRQLLLWPLQLMPRKDGDQIQRHWEALSAPVSSADGVPEHPWREMADPLSAGGDPARHYHELVTFLPFVQRFLYGDGTADGAERGAQGQRGSPMRVFCRRDVAAARVWLAADAEPIRLAVTRVRLYFFWDIDVVLLNLEVHADDLPLTTAQDLLYRFGRAYPAGWGRDGRALRCAFRVEWLSADDQVLGVSDTHERERFLSAVGAHRAPRIDAHWAWLLHPLVQDRVGDPGLIRFRQIEYYRMPLMGFLALEEPRALSRQDFLRLALVTAAGEEGAQSYSESYVADFENRYCYDRFWTRDGDGSDGLNTRYLCNGHGLLVVGDGRWSYFTNDVDGVLAQFRHQHFLLFLIAHFQKAALLMFSDQLVEALERLEVGNPESVKRFKRSIRQRFEIFLRFTHRYWFHEISDQALVRGLFRLCADHLGLDPLYAEVKERIHDMDEYLDSDSLRRQANTVVRLTVVTIVGLIGTITTGFLGMNLIAGADEPVANKLVFAAVVLVVSAWLTVYTVVKSKRLSDFLDALSDERLSPRAKLEAFVAVVRRRARDALRHARLCAAGRRRGFRDDPFVDRRPVRPLRPAIEVFCESRVSWLAPSVERGISGAPATVCIFIQHLGIMGGDERPRPHRPRRVRP